MKKILQYLFEYKTLGQSQAKEIIINIGKGGDNETEIASFITVFLMQALSSIDDKFQLAYIRFCW